MNGKAKVDGVYIVVRGSETFSRSREKDKNSRCIWPSKTVRRRVSLDRGIPLGNSMQILPGKIAEERNSTNQGSWGGHAPASTLNFLSSRIVSACTGFGRSSKLHFDLVQLADFINVHRFYT